MTALKFPFSESLIIFKNSKEADNFNVTRKLTVINARTDTILLEMEGTFSLSNNSDNELEVICEVGDGKYQKHFVYLNDDTMYVVEDISGAISGDGIYAEYTFNGDKQEMYEDVYGKLTNTCITQE